MPLVALLRFVTSPIGLGVAIGFAFLTIYQYGKHVGYANCRTEWVAANAAADLAKKKLEDKVARTVQELTQRHEAAIEQENMEFEKRMAIYETELAKRPDNRCVLNDADIRRLRH